MRSTEQLVGGLIQNLEPVRPIPRLRAAGAGALALGAISSAVVISLRGIRPDLVAGTVGPSVALIAIGLTVVALGGIAACVGAAVPGRERVARVGIGTLFAGLAVAAGAAGWGLVSMGAGAWEGLGLGCLTIAFFAGLLPGVGLLAFLVRAFPNRPAAALATAAGGAVGLGSISVHASCAVTGGLHVLIGHALAPLLGGAVLALLLYPVFLRFGKRGAREIAARLEGS